MLAWESINKLVVDSAPIRVLAPGRPITPNKESLAKFEDIVAEKQLIPVLKPYGCGVE